MQFYVLGPIEVSTPGGAHVEPAATKPRALLAVLLLHANAWVGVEQLIDGIWHEQAVPSSAVRNLRSYVWQLRKTLGERLESRPGAYRLRALPGETDLEQAELAVDAARAAMSDGAYETAVDQASGALALWRGTPFDDVAAEAAKARCAETRRELRTMLAEAQLALGRTAAAIAVLRELTDQEPLQEIIWTKLVLTLHQAGRTAEALAAYDRAKEILHSRLGIEPGRELVAAQRKVLSATEPAGNPRLSLVVGGGKRTGVDALLASATKEVLIMSAGAGPGPIDAIRRLSRASLRPGVRYRVLCPDAARLSGVLSAVSLAGVDVRTDAEVPMEALVVDRTAALLPADRATSPAGVAVFRLPGVVTATTGLFERIWQDAVPLAPADLAEARDAALTGRERDLLTLLCAGSTDESAAARLGISVRTVRRMVADIMNRLGARSRFQAGAKAAGRGWLLDRAG